MQQPLTQSSRLTSCCESETIEVGRKIGVLVAPGDRIYLCGDLGSGKTRIAKGLINAATDTPLDEINSPTFTLMNRYEGDLVVYHADLYRVESDDLSDLGIEMVEESQGVLVVEWAEKMKQHCEDALTIHLKHTEDEDVRIIILEWAANGPWSSRVRGMLTDPAQSHDVGCACLEQDHSFDGESLCRS